VSHKEIFAYQIAKENVKTAGKMRMNEILY